MTDRNEILNKLDNFLAANDYLSAKKHLLYHLKTAETQADNKNVLLVSNELMGLCRKLGEKEESLRYAEKALGVIKTMKIEKNVGAATTYLNCGTVYKAFGMSEKSIPLFKKTREIYENSLNEFDPRLSGLYNNMALALVDLKRFSEAEKLYKKAISVLKENKGKRGEEAITHLNLASMIEAEKGLENGEKEIEFHLNEAVKLLDSEENEPDGNYAFICEKCASVFGYFGYFAYENELTKRYRSIYERS